MSIRRVLDTPAAALPADVPGSPGVAAGPFVFVGATGATDWRAGLPAEALPDPGMPLSGDDPILIETRALYAKMAAVLADGGSSFARAVQINQWVNTYGERTERDPADRDEVALFYERWRSVVDPHLRGRNEFLLSDRPASACMPIDRLLCTQENVEVEMVALTDESGIEKRAYEHDVHMPLGGYSIGIEAGPLLYTAGFTGVDFVQGLTDAAKVPEFVWYGNQIRNETAETLRQLDVTVQAGGGRMADTVKATLFLTPWAIRNLPAIEDAWREVWPSDPPARTIIPCTGVGLRNTNVEIMLTVARPQHGGEREVIRTDEALPALGHAAQAVRSGPLLFLSSQLGRDASGAPAGTAQQDRAFPHLRRSVREQVKRIQDNADALCRAAGTSIDQTVRARLSFSDLDDAAAALPVWADAFTDGYPASGFFEGPPDTQEIPGCRVCADMIVAVSD